MINFVNLTGSETNLVAVGTETARRFLRNYPLRKFAFQRFAQRFTRVCRAGYAQCLINIRAPAKRVSDSAAETGSRAAVGFNFSRMVVRLVLVHDEPVFRAPVDVSRNFDTAGVDFVGFLDAG